MNMMMTPPRLDPVIDGEASFFTSPIRIVDTVVTGTSSAAANIGYRFETATFNGVGPTLRADISGGTPSNVPNQPQWTDSSLTLSQWDVRLLRIVSSTATTIGTMWDGNWYTLNTIRQFDVVKAGGGSIVFIVEIRKNTDGIIYGRAQLTYTVA